MTQFKAIGLAGRYDGYPVGRLGISHSGRHAAPVGGSAAAEADCGAGSRIRQAGAGVEVKANGTGREEGQTGPGGHSGNRGIRRVRLLKSLALALIFAFEAAFGAIKGKDDRKTYPETEMERRAMLATVRLDTGIGGMGTGILVLENNVLFTNHHVLYDWDTDERYTDWPVVQLHPQGGSSRVGFKSSRDSRGRVVWDNIACNKEKDYCVVELSRPVPGVRAVGVADGLPEHFIQDPSKLGPITISGFGVDIHRKILDRYYENQDAFTEAQAADIRHALGPGTLIKRVETCRARDFNELYGMVADCDSRKGNSGSGVVIPVEDMALLVAYVHSSFNKSEDGAPYDPKRNASFLYPITADVRADIDKVYFSSR